MKRSILISSSPVSQLCSSFKMSTHYLWRSRPQKAILTLALSGVGSWAVTSYFTRNAFADDGEPATAFPSKLGTSLRLESSESVNHNTKRLRFEFPNPTARSGLTLTSTVFIAAWPKGRWFPVIRPYTPVSSLSISPPTIFTSKLSPLPDTRRLSLFSHTSLTWLPMDT